MMKIRDTLWIFSFCGFAVNYMLRININIAIVAMVKQSNNVRNHSVAECLRNEDSTVAAYYSGVNQTSPASAVEVKRLFDWNEYEQNLILGSYYWLHWCMQIPGGLLAHYYSSKLVIGMANFLPGLLTFCIPFAANFSFALLVTIRFLQGFAAGALWPSMHSMVAKWVPPNERAKFVSSYLGSSVGATFTYLICGYIIDAYGWEWVFYVTGSLGTLWYLAWQVCIYDSPQQHPRISIEERNYIENSIGDALNKDKLTVPWKSILTSRYVLLTALANWGAAGATLTLITLTPTYLNFIHGLHIMSTGVWSGVPHLTKWLFSFVFGIFAQYQTITSTSTLRKLATATCTIGVGVLIGVLALSGCNTNFALAILLLTITIQGAYSAGPLSASIDLAPNFSGILLGIASSVAVTTGSLYPLLNGYLTQNNQTSAQWQKFFLIVSALTIACGTLDCVFGSSKLQPWNNAKPKSKESKPLKKNENENIH